MSDRTNKINFYLIKEGTDLQGIFKDPLNELYKKTIRNGYDLYYNKSLTVPAPWVKDFFKTEITEVRDGKKYHVFNTASSQAVLIRTVTLGQKSVTFAICFGTGYHLLKKDSYEPRFGLLTVLNVVAENSLRKIDKHDISGTPKFTAEQLSKKGSQMDFGLDFELDILLGASGTLDKDIKREKNLQKIFGTTLTGKSNLSVSSKFDLDDVERLLKASYIASRVKRYEDKGFAWIDKIELLKKKTQKLIQLAAKLDEKLIDNTQSPKLWLAVPELVEWQDITGFYFGSNRGQLYGDVTFEALRQVITSEISVEKLKSISVNALHSSGAKNAYQWSAYDCLYAEIDLDDDTYILINAEWYKLKGDFVADTNARYEEIITNHRAQISFKDYVDSDQNENGYSRNVGIPAAYSWQSLKAKKGAELEIQYVSTLRELGNKPGMLGQIFTKSQNKIQDPAKLYRLIDMVDDTDWVTMGADTKGDIYEGLLEKNAEDTKSGAGQYFTPRALIKAMVECLRPEPGKTIADPASGTGGFFLAAYDFLTDQKNYQLDKKQKAFLKHETFFGNEIVANTRRLCLMNMFLHNIGEIDGESAVSPNDALVASSGRTFDYVLANPPFGKKSSMSFTNEEGEQETDDLTYNRQDFWATTSNKQLNFVQHIRTMLKTTGRAAVVVPDNVLFEGGAGETIRRKLLDNTDLHTILRLPTGIFYANGVKANVLFFDNREASPEPWTKDVWYYDYRTNVHHTLKKKTMRADDLSDFIACYNPENRHKRKETWHATKNPEGRWRKFSYDELTARDKTSLDVFWLKDKSLSDLDNLPEPDELANDIIENLEAGLSSFREILHSLQKAG